MDSDGKMDGRLTLSCLVYLMATAILCGALVMVIEVLGSRVIGPFFGVSLYVWTSLITVTMIALASGYAVGGLVADRRGSADWLFCSIFGAGLMVLLVPLVRAPVLKACYPLGLRAGAFVSALLLFGPSLFLLGWVSPFLVKIATRQLERIGRTVGGFYALSTLGSVLGTLLTGFVLIGYLGVDRIFGFAGALLISLAVGYFVFLRRKWFAAAAALLPLILFPPSYSPGTSRLLDNGTRATSVAATDSFYGSIKVLDYTYPPNHTREIIIDGLVQGGIDLQSGLSIYPYPYFLERIPLALYPEGTSCLVIGLGAGIIPRGYQKHGVRTEVVDIDPVVVDFARTYFSYTDSAQTVIEDARFFLTHHAQRYDYVILDVFNGDMTPGYLLSREAVALLARRISDKGVLGINLFGSLRDNTLMTASVVRTLSTAFDQVEIYPTFDPLEGDGSGNLAVIAYSGPARHLDLQRFDSEEVHWLAKQKVQATIGRRFEFPRDTAAIVLTDDYNPIDFHDAKLRESVREGVLATTPWDLLIESS